jgi:hypothetical protein
VSWTQKEGNVLDKNRQERQLKCLAFLTFLLSPVLSWGSVIVSDETAVFASLSRMIWYSGDAFLIFIAMLVVFLPMIVSFFLAHSLSGISRAHKLICRICLLVSCIVLYIGAMELMPSDGESMTSENVLHGLLSFGGIFMIFLTYVLYTIFIHHIDRDGAFLLFFFLVFILITGSFAVLNVYDQDSYVIASAASELYILTMLSITGFLTFYLAYRKAKVEKTL